MNKGDYVEGYEYYGNKIQKMRGWVARVDVVGNIEIKCDDWFRGARCNLLDPELGDIKIVEEELGWYLKRDGYYYIILAYNKEKQRASYVTVLNEYNSTEDHLCYMLQGSLFDATKFEKSEGAELKKCFEDCKKKFPDRTIQVSTVDKDEVDKYGKRFLAKDLLPHKKPNPLHGSYIYSIFTAEDGSLYVDEDIYAAAHDEAWLNTSFWTFEAAYKKMVNMAEETRMSYKKEEI